MMHGDCPGTAALDVSACFQPRFPMHAPALRGDSMSDREISFGRCRDHLVIFLKPAGIPVTKRAIVATIAKRALRFVPVNAR
jgi:hypothetical protein